MGEIIDFSKKARGIRASQEDEKRISFEKDCDFWGEFLENQSKTYSDVFEIENILHEWIRNNRVSQSTQIDTNSIQLESANQVELARFTFVKNIFGVENEFVASFKINSHGIVFIELLGQKGKPFDGEENHLIYEKPIIFEYVSVTTSLQNTPLSILQEFHRENAPFEIVIPGALSPELNLQYFITQLDLALYNDPPAGTMYPRQNRLIFLEGQSTLGFFLHKMLSNGLNIEMIRQKLRVSSQRRGGPRQGRRVIPFTKV